MKSVFLFAIFFIPVISLAQHTVAPEYRNGTNVGDILPDSTLDDPGFKLCNEFYLPQYYSVGVSYEAGYPELARHFKKNYTPVEVKQSGFVTIRFAINCEGVAGRFRVSQIDDQYKNVLFDSAITTQLMRLTRSLGKWNIRDYKKDPRDCYMYLTFKIVDGKLIDVLP